MATKKYLRANLDDSLEDILSRLTIAQLRWVVERQRCDSDATAALTIGINPKSVGNWPPEVHRAAQLVAMSGVEAAVEIIKGSVMKAALVKVTGLDSRNEKVRQEAATEILDRIMGKPGQKVDLGISSGIRIDELDSTLNLLYGEVPKALEIVDSEAVEVPVSDTDEEELVANDDG